MYFFPRAKWLENNYIFRSDVQIQKNTNEKTNLYCLKIYNAIITKEKVCDIKIILFETLKIISSRLSN